MSDILFSQQCRNREGYIDINMAGVAVASAADAKDFAASAEDASETEEAPPAEHRNSVGRSRRFWGWHPSLPPLKEEDEEASEKVRVRFVFDLETIFLKHGTQVCSRVRTVARCGFIMESVLYFVYTTRFLSKFDEYIK